jgi:hypothetical protein
MRARRPRRKRVRPGEVHNLPTLNVLRHALHCRRDVVELPLALSGIEQSEQVCRGECRAADERNRRRTMPPFGGQGVNMAMLDALELADRLTSGRFTDLTEAISSYESDMLARACEAARTTAASQEAMLAPDAPDAFVAQVVAHFPQKEIR